MVVFIHSFIRMAHNIQVQISATILQFIQMCASTVRVISLTLKICVAIRRLLKEKIMLGVEGIEKQKFKLNFWLITFIKQSDFLKKKKTI